LILEAPEYLYLLFFLPLWAWGQRSFLRSPSLGFSRAAFLRADMKGGRSGMGLTFLKVMGLVLVVAALSRPQWEEREVLEIQPGIDIFLLVDVSSSMSESGTEDTRSTLEAGKTVMKDFASARTHDRLGLITFARFPKRVCPLTTDQDALMQFIDAQVCMDQGSALDGTAIGAALGEAARCFHDAPLPDGTAVERDRVVVLLTDGEENQYIVDPDLAAALCADLKIKVYPISTGEGGAYFRFHEAIAEATGGRAEHVTRPADLKPVYQRIDRLEKRPVAQRTLTSTRDLFRWLLLPGALLLWLEFLLARTVYLRVP
jgi:Ca-activated chloride channel family protein